MSLRARPWSVAVLGGGCLAEGLLLWASGAFDLRENIRERSLDNVLPFLAPAPATSSAVVVDIDRESLARYGAWPWRRQILADTTSSSQANIVCFRRHSPARRPLLFRSCE